MCEPSDQAGVSTVLNQHHEAAWAWAMVCCRQDRDLAHDVLHDVYVKVLQQRVRFLGRSTFKTWLFGVIRVSAQAARRRKSFLGLIFDPIADHPHLAGAVVPPALLATSPRLQQTLAALPRRQRQLVALVFEHDLTLDEAGSVLGISPGASRRHYARAKSRLRTCVQDLEPHDE
jgi:RNA polymerase sigma-70 factor (ECF subfamily)